MTGIYDDGATYGPDHEETQFFQPGQTYSGRYGWKFRCDTITTHPEDGERTALGWRYFNEVWEPYAYGEGDWEIQQSIAHRVGITASGQPASAIEKEN